MWRLLTSRIGADEFFLANQGYWLLKGVDGLDEAVDDVLHGFEGVGNITWSRNLVGFDE